MNAECLRDIFQAGLLPFIWETFPDGHRIMIPSMPVILSANFLKNMLLTGGPLHLNPQILIQSKMCGVH